jgi:undecaprenyl-diphosphatase
MEEILKALILGIVQGLTEFLPVSSSGHIEIANFIMKADYEDKSNLLMTVVLHAATALSTIVILRKDILEILKGLFQFQWNEQSQFSLKIILSMIPAVIVGLTMEDFLESLFGGNIMLVGTMLILTAILLFFADKAKNTTKDVSFLNALLIGISQAIAILPGISRSGATISTSVLLGIDRTKAAKFSFLMVVPLIFGKMAKDVMDGALTQTDIRTSALIVGFIAAFTTGLIACKWMIALVKKSKLIYFSIYCALVGIIGIAYMSFS